MEALKAENVSRRYGERLALDGFALSVERGGFDALMGPSGSGKSTFLHLAAGLLAADSGSILVGGRDVAAMSDAEATRFRRRHVGVVFQAYNLLPEKTVRDNILLPLRLDRARPAEGRLESLAETLGISGVLDRRAGALSGGEQQRVAVARALVASPDIVLADEPTGNLDAVASRSLCGLLKRLNESGESAILLVTHDPVVAAAASRVHFLKDGRIASTHPTGGDPARVSELYLETFR